jgi:hypothetical protein
MLWIHVLESRDDAVSERLVESLHVHFVTFSGGNAGFVDEE